MLNKYLSKNLKEGETILRIVKRYALFIIIRLTVFGLLMLLDFFFMTYFINNYWWGMIVFAVILVFSGIMIYRSWYIWSLNVLIVTDQRLIDIDQKGFFNRTVSETIYRKIQDVSYSIKGMAPTMFHYGTITIQTAGTQGKIMLDYIHNPEQIQDLLTELQDQMEGSSPAIEQTNHD
ncbi:MAG: PH domain-containing protein [bacterium]